MVYLRNKSLAHMYAGSCGFVTYKVYKACIARRLWSRGYKITAMMREGLYAVRQRDLGRRTWLGAASQRELSGWRAALLGREGRACRFLVRSP